MAAMTGMSQFGAPSPPPGRNSLFLNNLPNSMSSQGLGTTKHVPRPNTLASAISRYDKE